MAKQIKISDEIYERLRKSANGHYRTLGGQIDYLLGFAGSPEVRDYEVETYEKRAAEWEESQRNLPEVMQAPAYVNSKKKTRGKGDVLSDIREAEASRDEELRYCQDSDESFKITEKYALLIQPLWDEFAEISGEK